MEKWQGKVAIVTGSSSGIGAAISEKLVKAGVTVVGVARRKDRLDELKGKLQNESGQFYPFVADVSQEKDILSAFEWTEENLGPVYILVNNAGFKRNTNLIEGSTEMWKEIFDVQVVGLCVATREAVKRMRKHNIAGHIIHMNGLGGHKVVYFPRSNVYPASKFAVTALTETLRQELNSIGSKIKISSISPGLVETEFLGPTMKDMIKDIPHLKAEDVADAALYVLGTPPHVQVHELIIQHVEETY